MSDELKVVTTTVRPPTPVFAPVYAHPRYLSVLVVFTILFADSLLSHPPPSPLAPRPSSSSSYYPQSCSSPCCCSLRSSISPNPFDPRHSRPCRHSSSSSLRASVALRIPILQLHCSEAVRIFCAHHRSQLCAGMAQDEVDQEGMGFRFFTCRKPLATAESLAFARSLQQDQRGGLSACW